MTVIKQASVMSGEHLQNLKRYFDWDREKVLDHDTQHIIAFSQMFHTRFVGVHNGHIMVFLTELLRQRSANLAAAHQNDLHNKSFLFPRPFCRDSTNPS